VENPGFTGDINYFTPDKLTYAPAIQPFAGGEYERLVALRSS